MNELSRPIRMEHKTTQAADGLPRLAWTLAEFERLSELGFFGGADSERERLELVDGELIPMNAKGARHELVRSVLQKFLVLRLGEAFDVFSEPGWRPGGDMYLEPEMLICNSGAHPANVAPRDVLLLIEVADTSLKYDQGMKSKIYARLGVREYWVVNAVTLETTVYLEPGSGGYCTIATIAPSEDLASVALPALALRIGDLKFG